MRFKKLNYFIVIIIIYGCSKENIIFENLVDDVKLSKESLIADGRDALKVEIVFNEAAEISKISGKASINNAKIQDSESNEIDLKPVTLSNGDIVSELILTSTTINSDHTLIINVNEYRKSFNIRSIKSIPSSVKLESSASSVGEDFSSEIKLEATLASELGRSVSNGTKVTFSDFYKNGDKVNGVFREVQSSSNNESKTSAFYSPGLVDGNQYIDLKVEVLDSLGNPTGISDIKQIFITPKE